MHKVYYFFAVLVTFVLVTATVAANSEMTIVVGHDPAYGTEVTLETNVDSIVLVQTPGYGSGTGFYISENYIITNAHVVGHASEVMLSRRSLPRPGMVIASNEDLDVAVIYTEQKGRPVTLYNSYHNLLHEGDFLYSLGINNYEYETAKTGRVLKSKDFYPLRDFETIITDLKLEPGYSGGPTFDASNTLIGINVATGWNAVKQYSYIIPIEGVLPFIQKVIIKHDKRFRLNRK
jgi:S1-C subfamily serine protease